MKPLLTIYILASCSLLYGQSATTGWSKVLNQSVELGDTAWIPINWDAITSDKPTVGVDSVKIQYAKIEGIVMQRMRFYYKK